MTDAHAVLRAACAQAGLPSAGAELIRAGENTLYRLPGHVVARVTRAGQLHVARKETQVSGWLRDTGVPVVEALAQIDQPIAIDGHAVTFWRELPAHTRGTIDQIADMLRRIHRLPVTIELPSLAPFVRLDQRIAETTLITDNDKTWLRHHLQLLQDRYAEQPPGLPHCAVHGDASGGNVVNTATGPVLLDLERFAYGPPEWDLVSIAVEHVTFGTLSAAGWRRFCHRYGTDVTDWTGYALLRDIRELRKVTFAIQMADQQPHLRDQTLYRIACIQGEIGPRPWHWKPVP